MGCPLHPSYLTDCWFGRSSEEVPALYISSRTDRTAPQDGPELSRPPPAAEAGNVVHDAGVAYCAGLRLAEIVGLELRDVDFEEGTIEVRDTKFFKSRRLPLSSSAVAALRDYLVARRKAGASQEPLASLFVHEKGGYSHVTAGALLRDVIRRAGLRTGRGRVDHGSTIFDTRLSSIG